MARIRNLKPDFWTDEKLVELEPWERLLFIGLWNFADDQGYMPFSPKRIKMQVFPADSLEVSRGLQSLISIGALTLYDSVAGQVLQVTNWHKHQKVSNPARSKYDDMDLSLAEVAEQKPRKQAEVAQEIPEDYVSPTESSRGLHKEREREGGMEREVEGERGGVVPSRNYVTERGNEISQRTRIHLGASIVNSFNDHIPETLPSKTRQDLTAHVTVALQDGIAETFIRRGIELWYAKALGPGALPGFIFEAQREANGAGASIKSRRATGTERAMAAIEVADQFREQEAMEAINAEE